MSFSAEQKKHIIEYVYKSACCRRALLTGVIFASGKVTGEGVIISLEKEAYADLVSKLSLEFYSLECEKIKSCEGGRRKLLFLKSKSAAKYIVKLRDNGDLYQRKCAFCKSAFLRGVFLAAGRVSDPEKQYSLEFSLGERTDIFYELLTENYLSPKISEKKSGRVIYIKDSYKIQDFFALCSLNSVVFDIIDAKMKGELTKDVVRKTNCETNNIQKAVDASAKQVALIKRLEEARLLSSLSEELEQTARLRLKYPDLSLSQLAAEAPFSITKPGLAHRLRKIMETGTILLNGD